MQFAYGRQLRTNPLIETYRTQKVIFMVIMVMYFFMTVVSVFIYLNSTLTVDSLLQFLNYGSVYLFQTFLFPFSYLNAAAQLFYWRKIEMRRLAAANRRDLWNATEQPVANPTALVLPVTISSPPLNKPGLRIYSKLILMVLAFSLFIAWFGSELVFGVDRWYGFLIIFAVTALLLGGLSIVLATTRLGRSRIFVTEQGVKIGKTLIRWEEVELFAIYHTYTRKRSGTSITYELSSATDILRWATVQRAADVQPDDADMEYARQLQALSQMVVARTGLPLADLRDRPVED